MARTTYMRKGPVASSLPGPVCSGLSRDVDRGYFVSLTRRTVLYDSPACFARAGAVPGLIPEQPKVWAGEKWLWEKHLESLSGLPGQTHHSQAPIVSSRSRPTRGRMRLGPSGMLAGTLQTFQPEALEILAGSPKTSIPSPLALLQKRTAQVPRGSNRPSGARSPRKAPAAG